MIWGDLGDSSDITVNGCNEMRGLLACIQPNVVSWPHLCTWAEVTRASLHKRKGDRWICDLTVLCYRSHRARDKHVPTEVVKIAVIILDTGAPAPCRRMQVLQSWEEAHLVAQHSIPGPLHYFSFIIHLVKSVKCFLKQEVGVPHHNICRHLHRLRLEMLTHRMFCFLFLSKEAKVIFF